MKHVICDNQLPEGVEHIPESHITPDRKLSFILMDDSIEIPNAIYEAKWDGKAESLTVVKGDPKTLTHKYAGWPDA